MDTLQPSTLWIGKRCYRENPTSFHEDVGNEPPTQINYSVENDDYDQESCEADIPIQKLDDGRFRVTMSIPSEFFPRIIGRCGENKIQLEKETRTHITIPKKGQHGDIVVTGCDHKGVVSAHSQITLLVSNLRKRYPFTHFISIPLISKNIQMNFEKFQKDVLDLMKQSKDVDHQLFQNPCKLHITVGTLVLLNDEERKKAADILTRCKDGIREIVGPTALKVEIVGIEYMNDDPERIDVLYGKCIDQSNRLQHLVDFLVESFVNAGLMDRQYDRVKIHVTLMNTLFKMDSDSEVRPTFNGRPIIEEFRDYSFGTQIIEEVHLSQRHSTSKNTGYYVATSQIGLDWRT